jgi:hypothetical protein
MKLAGAVIRSSDEALPVLDGKIRSFYLDRRDAREEIRAGMAARRRKPPPELRDLVGKGKLCVAKGEFEILEVDVKRHRKGSSMRLEVRDVVMYISHLSDAIKRGEVQRWNFAALFVPTPDQQRWILTLETPVVHHLEPATPRQKPEERPAPVFFREHLESQMEFLRGLADLKDD